MPDPNRTYTEKEIAKLLERTAQLQADDVRDEQPSTSGLSLSELETIASEAGLDPEYLHRAALEIESTGKKGFQNRTATHIHTQRFLSQELTEDVWEELVFELRRSFASNSSIDMTGLGSFGNGVVEQIGRSREWRHTSPMGVHTSVLLRPYKEGTRIEMSQKVGAGSPKSEAIGYGFLLSILPAFILAVIFGKSLLVGAASFTAFMAMLVPLVYLLDMRWRDKKLANLESVAERLVEFANEKASLASPVVEPRLETSTTSGMLELEDEELAPEAVRTQRTKNRS